MMTDWVSILLAGLLVTDLLLVMSGRLMHCIKLVAAQGILLGILLFLAGDVEKGIPELAVTALVNLGVKGVVLPLLLIRAVRLTRVKREIEPMISYSASLLIAAAAILVAFWGCQYLELPRRVLSPIAAPAAFSTMFVGLFLIVSRRKAITQAIGFLAFENGIGFFGVGLLIEHGLMVELGILLDVLVLVFVMGITVFQIRREFQHIFVDKLTALGDFEDDGKAVRK